MNDKQLVAEYAASRILDGMLVGLGTGSTANYFIDALARRMREESLTISTVSSSVVSAIKAHTLGLPLVGIDQVERLDVYVDGADEVDSEMSLLKGKGSDLVREKLLAQNSHAFWVLIDQSKRVERLASKSPVPVEVMPFAWRLVLRSIEAIGGRGGLRLNSAGDGIAVTAHGSLILDIFFDTATDITLLNNTLSAIPGVVEHGIFHRLATEVFCGVEGKIQRQTPDKI
ncbi:MAG: hypothetical protein RLZ92_624 [Pseudomonadota bacterium]|jgi:ribose 5-phosphate isomerase A